MFFPKGTKPASIISAIGKLKAEDFVTVEVGSKAVDSVQVMKMPDESFHFEILLKNGDPKVFSGNRILAMDDLDFATTAKFCEAILMTGDTKRIPVRNFQDITKKAAKIHPEAAEMR